MAVRPQEFGEISLNTPSNVVAGRIPFDTDHGGTLTLASQGYDTKAGRHYLCLATAGGLGGDVIVADNVINSEIKFYDETAAALIPMQKSGELKNPAWDQDNNNICNTAVGIFSPLVDSNISAHYIENAGGDFSSMFDDDQNSTRFSIVEVGYDIGGVPAEYGLYGMTGDMTIGLASDAKIVLDDDISGTGHLSGGSLVLPDEGRVFEVLAFAKSELSSPAADANQFQFHDGVGYVGGKGLNYSPQLSAIPGLTPGMQTIPARVIVTGGATLELRMQPAGGSQTPFKIIASHTVVIVREISADYMSRTKTVGTSGSSTIPYETEESKVGTAVTYNPVGVAWTLAAGNFRLSGQQRWTGSSLSGTKFSKSYGWEDTEPVPSRIGGVSRSMNARWAGTTEPFSSLFGGMAVGSKDVRVAFQDGTGSGTFTANTFGSWAMAEEMGFSVTDDAPVIPSLDPPNATQSPDPYLANLNGMAKSIDFSQPQQFVKDQMPPNWPGPLDSTYAYKHLYPSPASAIRSDTFTTETGGLIGVGPRKKAGFAMIGDPGRLFRESSTIPEIVGPATVFAVIMRTVADDADLDGHVFGGRAAGGNNSSWDLATGTNAGQNFRWRYYTLQGVNMFFGGYMNLVQDEIAVLALTCNGVDILKGYKNGVETLSRVDDVHLTNRLFALNKSRDSDGGSGGSINGFATLEVSHVPLFMSTAEILRHSDYLLNRKWNS